MSKNKTQDFSQNEENEKYFEIPILSNVVHNWYIWILIRVFMSIYCTQNMLQADQWWQSTEIAYAWVYGNDHTNQPLPWEWRTEYALRTVIFPAFIALPLYILKSLGLDFHLVVVYFPSLYHCVFLLIMDYFFKKLCVKHIGKGIGTTIALSLYLFNHTFC